MQKFIESFRFMSTSLSNLVDNYLKFTTKSAEDVKKEKKISMQLLDFKIINYITNTKNVKKDS